MQSSQNTYIKITASDGHSHSGSCIGPRNRKSKNLNLDASLIVSSKLSQCSGAGTILCSLSGLLKQ